MSGFQVPENLGTRKFSKDSSSSSSSRDSSIDSNIDRRIAKHMEDKNRWVVEPKIETVMYSQLSPKEILKYKKEVRHLEMYMANDDILSANSENDPRFWDKCKIVGLTQNKEELFSYDNTQCQIQMNRALRAIGEDSFCNDVLKVQERSNPGSVDGQAANQEESSQNSGSTVKTSESLM